MTDWMSASARVRTLLDVFDKTTDPARKQWLFREISLVVNEALYPDETSFGRILRTLMPFLSSRPSSHS
jgi:hypothetical protein